MKLKRGCKQTFTQNFSSCYTYLVELDKINEKQADSELFSQCDAAQLLALVRAKKLEILQEGEDFFQAVAPLITKPAVARLKTSRIKLQDFLKI